jgi:hypothetical protein
MSEWSQGLTRTQNVDWGFLLNTTLLTTGGLLLRLTTYKCLLGVLCPVRRPIPILDCLLLKDNNRALVAWLGLEVNSWACLCVLQGPRHNTKCWLSIQRFIFLLVFCLRDPQERLRSNKPLNRTVSRELVGDFIFSYPSIVPQFAR